MAILDGQQNMTFHEPVEGSFSSPEVIDVTGRLSNQDLNLVQFADTGRLRMSILETTEVLCQKNLHPEFKRMTLESLEEKLKELAEELQSARNIEIGFSHNMTMYSSAYDGLLAAYGQESGPDAHRVVIPRPQVGSFLYLPGQESDHSFNPRILLSVYTGHENPVSIYREYEVVEEEGPPRWFEFPVATSSFAALGLPTS